MADLEQGSIVDARPIKEGYDPLTAGNSLSNPTNTEDHNSYEVLESVAEVIKAEKEGVRIKQEYQVHAQVAARPAKKVPNKSEAQLAEVIKSSKRTGR